MAVSNQLDVLLGRSRPLAHLNLVGHDAVGVPTMSRASFVRRGSTTPS
ncbi:hypothetical protein OG874_16515 [Nocardia sp. NBC_00565]|nr:hypothetical protein [Nocardia sp. NBC_00565]WUC06622.1 hypothetical protein OG874_16515 [Nocardia sp. NBC_00565]